MPIRVRCPRCWETAELPDEARGRMGKCNSCGAIVRIPERITKVCFLCGKDVTHLKHTKDLDNNYLCMDCWNERNPDQQASFNIPSVECSVCHATFAEGEGFEQDGKPVCKDCFSRPSLKGGNTAIFGDEETVHSAAAEGSELPPQVIARGTTLSSTTLDDLVHIRTPEKHEEDVPLPPSAKTPENWEPLSVVGEREFPTPEPSAKQVAQAAANSARSSARPAMVVAILALLLAGFVLYRQIRPDRSWEEQHRVRIEVLKAEGDVLVEAGRSQMGIEKYRELLRLVDGHTIKDASLLKLISETRTAAERAAALVIDPWEEQNRTRLLILKAQGELLVTLGNYRQGIDKYTEMIRLAAGHRLSPSMRQEIHDAQMARQDALLAERDGRDPAATQLPPAATDPHPAPRVNPSGTDPAPPPQTRPAKATGVPPVPVPASHPGTGTRPNIFDNFEAEPNAPRPPEKPSTRKSVFD